MPQCIIRNANGNPIQHSRNLRGIRQYVATHLIKTLAIDTIENGEGKLSILFDDSSSYEMNFADFGVLRNFVRRWRNVYGAPLLVNGSQSGIVEYRNDALTS